jgi:ABC-type bacteriocin/lantibiotic exporter with double-glycine peptidase domain
LLDHTQGKYSSLFSKEDLSLRKAQARSMFISQSPRYVIEALGIVMVTLIAYYYSNSSDGVINAIPVLGAFALAAQRLLPILQQIFSSWTGIQSGKKSLQDVVMLLIQPMPSENDGSNGPPIKFLKEIKLNNIRFRYKNEFPWVLKDINLTISKGSRVGIVGSTGCGKSTLMDILLGLLSPTHGDLRVDECVINQTNSRLWQSLISHVPQNIYLSDNSIAENIAFIDSSEDLDMARVRHCAEQAQLSESIDKWPKKYETLVGERGIRLSGGQRQRIGIARALYKNASIIMLDEATSALDGETEDSVMKVIEELDSNLTIIIIAHRLTTLRKCTEIITLANGVISSVSSHKDKNAIL